MGPAPLVRRFTARPDQLPGVRHDVAEYARQQHAADIGGIELALTEAVANAIVHAYRDASTPGEVEVIAERVDRWLRISVGDQGSGITPRPDSPGIGVGLPLIASLADSVDITPNGDAGTRLTMTFPLLDANGSAGSAEPDPDGDVDASGRNRTDVGERSSKP
jgi:serine/threonine-protein kinase RsbW